MAHISDCADVDRALGTRICKNLFLCNAAKTDFYLLLMPGEKKFKTSEVSRFVKSSRLSFASPEDMERLLCLTPGSVSVMGLMNDAGNRVRLLIDDEILSFEEFACHPCVNTASIRFRTADLFETLLPAMHHEALPLALSD